MYRLDPYQVGLRGEIYPGVVGISAQPAVRPRHYTLLPSDPLLRGSEIPNNKYSHSRAALRGSC